MKKSPYFCFVLFALCFLLASCATNSTYPTLTACLQEKQIVMFGASWCPHCADQKTLFGRSVKDMPYFECSKGGTQVEECNARGITSYPTWQFQEATLKALPEEAITSLYDGELAKVRASLEGIQKTLTADDAAAKKILDDFTAKLETDVNSDMPTFEKLKKLTAVTVGPDGKATEMPMYVSGRIGGVRPVSEIALYAGCSAEYQADTTAQTK